MILRAFAFLALLSTFVSAQTPSAPAPAAKPPAGQAQEQASETPTAKPDDVSSMDNILHALYDVISGPAGQKRDWNRMRSLFIPGARLIPAAKRPSGEVTARVMSVDDYIARAQPFFDKEGFFESEIARHADEYGHISQVFSTYESRHEKTGKPFARGINSIQLLNDGKRWWVVTIYWEGETPETAIPEKYLHSGK